MFAATFLGALSLKGKVRKVSVTGKHIKILALNKGEISRPVCMECYMRKKIQFKEENEGYWQGI